MFHIGKQAMERILVTGSLGQLGTELVMELQRRFGVDQILATDIHAPSEKEFPGRFSTLDVTDKHSLIDLVKENKITQIYHLAAILSANAEKSPQLAWKINMDGLINILEVAREFQISKIYWPSSIAVFGPDSPKEQTPQNTVMNPNTIYGITKVAGEKLCAYYHEKYGLDVRSLRYPGLIGYKSLPGGGTTDYAVEIYHEALKSHQFTCPIGEHTQLPMMYMEDAVRATMELMEAPAQNITVRTSYNLAGVSFSPKEIAESIKKTIPEFRILYRPDFRDKIAASWPDSIDDHVARADWKWKVAYNLDRITDEMLCHLKERQLVSA